MINDVTLRKIISLYNSRLLNNTELLKIIKKKSKLLKIEKIKYKKKSKVLKIYKNNKKIISKSLLFVFSL